MASRISVAKPRIATIDTRRVRPPAKIAEAELQTPEHRAWAEEVKRRAGYRCEAIHDGRRCGKAAPAHRMFADHIRERRDGGEPLDPKNGQCLCGSDHSLKTAKARAARFKAWTGAARSRAPYGDSR